MLPNVFITTTTAFTALFLYCPPPATSIPILSPKEAQREKLSVLTGQIILTLKENAMVSQIFSSSQEMSLEGRLDGEELYRAHIPAFLYAQGKLSFCILVKSASPTSFFLSILNVIPLF